MATKRKSPSSQCLLAIDAGNTRVKWGLHDGGRWVKRGHADTARAAQLKSAFARLPPLRAVIVSNVAGKALRASLKRAQYRDANGETQSRQRACALLKSPQQ